MSSVVDQASEPPEAKKRTDTFTETIDQQDRNEERKIGGTDDGSRRPSLERSAAIAGDDRPTLRPRVTVESGYLTKSPRSARPAPKPEVKMEVQVATMSHMEREAIQDRTRMALIRQMTDYLSSDGSSRYTKDTFRRVFTEKVRHNLFRDNHGKS